MQRKPSQLVRRAFTLVELLVVIGIGHVETMAYVDTWKPIGPNPLGGTTYHQTMWQVAGWTKGLPQQN